MGDGTMTVFGKVLEGWSVVQSLVKKRRQEIVEGESEQRGFGWNRNRPADVQYEVIRVAESGELPVEQRESSGEPPTIGAASEEAVVAAAAARSTAEAAAT